MGGFARMKTLIDEKRKEDPGLLLLDGGDFSMGTLYQTINRTRSRRAYDDGKAWL